MKKIFQVFARDMKAVFTNVWAAIIVIGIMIIPALYAWFNINSNWNSYGATSGIKIAVANTDEGGELEGMSVNVGGMIVDNLAKNDAIGWQFVSKEQALSGVRSGEYYAAVIIPEDFTSSIESIADLIVKQPEITYYVNEKKNAIAPKITETGINTIQVQVNETIVETATSVLQTIASQLTTKVEGSQSEIATQVTDRLQEVIDTLSEYQTLVSAVLDASHSLQSSLDAASALLPQADAALESAKQAGDYAGSILSDSKATASDLSSTISAALEMGTTQSQTISDQLESALNALSEDGDAVNEDVLRRLHQVISLLDSAISQTTSVKTTLTTLMNQSSGKLNILSSVIQDLETRLSSLQSLKDKVQTVCTKLENAQSLAEEEKTALLQDAADLVSFSTSLKNGFDSNIQPQIQAVFSTLDSSLASLNALGNSGSSLSTTISGSFSSVNEALGYSSSALEKTSQLMGDAKQKLESYIEEIQSAADDVKIEKIEELLERDPVLLSDFMKEPVKIKTESVYPIANYGSGMAPFYTTLAIWVGALVNCAIIKTKILKKNEEEEDLSPDQAYFGRYLFFAFVSVCQSLIICLGDLYMLHIQCLNPFCFCLMGVFCGIVFSLLMYTLTVSFGDVGKAIAVIIMVVQVAGSGGTYPIEILPELYQKLYPFFPFNYAINGMRECVGGMYGNAFWEDMAWEACFIPVSLVIGLALRKPIIRLKEYIEERVESTGLLG